MGRIHDRFRADECRIEQGVFLPDDEVILLVDHEECRFEVGRRVPLARLVADEPEGWCSLDRQSGCRLSEPDLLVVGGSTSWEGEGWLAALQPEGERLLWLLHLERSEVFVAVRRDGDQLVAVSRQYPTAYEWRVPLGHPERLSCAPFKIDG